MTLFLEKHSTRIPSFIPFQIPVRISFHLILIYLIEILMKLDSRGTKHTGLTIDPERLESLKGINKDPGKALEKEPPTALRPERNQKRQAKNNSSSSLITLG